MNKLIQLLFILISLCIQPVFASEQDNNAVLISASGKLIPEFTNKEIRLLYLGFPVTKEEQTYEPLINASDPVTYKQFLQKVMFMTENRYQRQLISRVFRNGGEQPIRFDDKDNLINSLKNKTNTITFVMAGTASQLDNVQVIQRLW